MDMRSSWIRWGITSALIYSVANIVLVVTTSNCIDIETAFCRYVVDAYFSLPIFPTEWLGRWLVPIFFSLGVSHEGIAWLILFHASNFVVDLVIGFTVGAAIAFARAYLNAPHASAR